MMMLMMMRMMMMNMTQMKLVNSATKFRHGMDKFYQPNSGLRSSRSLDEAIYIHIHIWDHTRLLLWGLSANRTQFLLVYIQQVFDFNFVFAWSFYYFLTSFSHNFSSPGSKSTKISMKRPSQSSTVKSPSPYPSPESLSTSIDPSKAQPGRAPGRCLFLGRCDITWE